MILRLGRSCWNMSGTIRSVNKWIEDNGNFKVEPRQTLQYLRLLQFDYPHLSIVSGAIFYDMEVKGRKNYPGKHYWCIDENGRIYDVSKHYFDAVHDYKQLKIFKSGEL